MKKSAVYSTQFLQPGLVGFPETGERILIRKEAVERMAFSFIGKPVVYQHKEELRTGGCVTNVWYDPIDGWFWCTLSIDDPNAITLLDKMGWSFSCSYSVTEKGRGGEINAIKYTEEVLNGVFDHMAVVDDPRYSEIKFVRNNSRKKGVKEKNKMLGFFGNKAKPPVRHNSRENSEREHSNKDNLKWENHADKHIEVQYKNGEIIPIKIEELVNSHRRHKENSYHHNQEHVFKEECIYIDDEPVMIQDLIDIWEDEFENSRHHNAEHEKHEMHADHHRNSKHNNYDDDNAEYKKENDMMNSRPEYQEPRKNNEEEHFKDNKHNRNNNYYEDGRFIPETKREREEHRGKEHSRNNETGGRYMSRRDSREHQDRENSRRHNSRIASQDVANSFNSGSPYGPNMGIAPTEFERVRMGKEMFSLGGSK